MEQEEIALIVRNEHQGTDCTATDASNRETTSDTLEECRDQNNVPAQENPIVPSDLEPQEGTSPEIIALSLLLSVHCLQFIYRRPQDVPGEPQDVTNSK